MKYFNLDQTKYLSLILVLSFIVLHKIYLVLAGIIIALINLNKNYIINVIQFKSKISEKEEMRISKSIDIEAETMKIKYKNNKHKLVEQIEELGYIPTIEKGNDTNAV